MTWISIAFGVASLLALIGGMRLGVLWFRHEEAHRFADAHNATIAGWIDSGAPIIPKHEKYFLLVRWPGRLCRLPFEPGLR